MENCKYLPMCRLSYVEVCFRLWFLQGRNFGLNSGGTNSEGERSILGSRGERG